MSATSPTNPVRVIDAILRELPEGEYGRLRSILTARRACAITAPQSEWPHIWGMFGTTLGLELGTPDTGWKQTIAGYVSGTLPLPPEATEETMS